MKKSEFIEKYGVEAYERQLEQKRQYMHRYDAEHREEKAERNKQRYAENREEILAKQKQYNAEHREEKLAYKKQYDATHKEEKRQYDAAHKEERAVYKKQYYSTPIGRAAYLAGGYRKMDKQKGFVNIVNQVTKEWIVDNIFTKSCIYCGESDWTKLGCDRIDNNKPHTIDNVVCCCGNCNKERNTMPFDEFMAMKKKKSLGFSAKG